MHAINSDSVGEDEFRYFLIFQSLEGILKRFFGEKIVISSAASVGWELLKKVSGSG